MPPWKASLDRVDAAGESFYWQTANATRTGAVQSDQISLGMFFGPLVVCLPASDGRNGNTGVFLIRMYIKGEFAH
jgi:hypothetical protein